MLANKILIIFIYILNNLLTLAHTQDTDGELLAVSLLYRHGDRTPESFYQDDPYKDPSFWPVLPGELTNDGKRRHYNLGKWLRERYNDFLPQKYSPTDIYVRSADINRCLDSATTDLSGLFPPKDDQIWDSTLPWQPIPVHTVAIETDGVIELEKPCPKFDYLSKKLANTGTYGKIEKNNKKLYEYLTNATGDHIHKLSQASHLYDTLFIESLYNYTLPDWTKEVYPEPLLTCSKQSFAFRTSTPKLAKFRVGQIFHKIEKQFNNFTSKSTSHTHKLKVYSVHDSNIFDILNSLGTPNMELIPYAATLIFELRNSTSGTFVRMLYKTDNVTAVSIGGCDLNCSYSDFLKKLKPLKLSNSEWEKACKLSAIESVEESIKSIFDDLFWFL
ncbi:hypothetical protein HHI36_004067 [Cryptolaemus montrouzieri]|uniref:acid phosphatase n=1 Tax=Cryptolaemus montrouzieri TaxID=559131 RepID=A0ABD2NQ37_9CUCU